MTTQTSPVTGFRGNGPTYQDLLDTDSKPVPESMRRDEPGYFGDRDVPVVLTGTPHNALRRLRLAERGCSLRPPGRRR